MGWDENWYRQLIEEEARRMGEEYEAGELDCSLTRDQSDAVLTILRTQIDADQVVIESYRRECADLSAETTAIKSELRRQNERVASMLSHNQALGLAVAMLLLGVFAGSFLGR